MAHFIWWVTNKMKHSKLERKNVNIFSNKHVTFKIIIIFLHRFLEDVLNNGIEN